jgi:hypothetical protein
MRKLTIALVLASVLALSACGGGGTSDTNSDEVVPVQEDTDAPDEEIYEAIWAKYPDTLIGDIDASYYDAKTSAPDASDDQIVAWMIELLDLNTASEAWNDCLEAHDGYDVGCTEPKDPEEVLSRDNPLWG